MNIEHCLLSDFNTKESVAYIEKCINSQMKPLHCLRMMCLLSVCRGGLDSKLFKSLKLQYLQVRKFTNCYITVDLFEKD